MKIIKYKLTTEIEGSTFYYFKGGWSSVLSHPLTIEELEKALQNYASYLRDITIIPCDITEQYTCKLKEYEEDLADVLEGLNAYRTLLGLPKRTIV